MGGDRERNRKGTELLLSMAKELLLGTRAGILLGDVHMDLI